MSVLISILNLLDRPDLKSKLTQELHRQIGIFSRLSNSPEVCGTKLTDTLNKLNLALPYFSKLNGKIGQSLRDNEFIATVRQRMLAPAHDANFETPVYHYWLQLNESKGVETLHAWFSELAMTRDTANLLLDIIRLSSEFKALHAEKGFYYQSLPAESPCQLIRIQLAKSHKAYPEISASKHRLNIRFMTPHFTDRATQYQSDLPFQLAICAV
jgi:cell division protein ZapD